MSKLTRENCVHYCRTCLTNLKECEKNGEFRMKYQIKTENLGYWIEDFTSLQMMANDEYPQYICEGCYSIFKTFHEFRELVWQSADKLKDLLEIPKNEPLVYNEADSNSATFKEETNSDSKVDNNQNESFKITSTDATDFEETSETDEQQFKIEEEFVRHENLICLLFTSKFVL